MRFGVKIIPLLALAGALMISNTSFAQVTQQAMVCKPYKTITSQLIKQYKETRTVMGVTAKGKLFEVYASEKGTWSLIITDTNKVACLMAAGNSFGVLQPKKPAF